MHARAGTLQIAPEKVDDVVSQLEQESLPSYRQQKGFKGFTVLADRSSGRVVGISFWESEADLQAAEELGSRSRASAAQTGGATGEPAVNRYEVLLDEMV